jgi:hypothetical protein
MPPVQKIIHSRANLSDLLAHIVHYSLLWNDRTFLTEHTIKIVILAKISPCEGGDLCTTPVLTRFGFHMKKWYGPPGATYREYAYLVCTILERALH